ncbi:hypothetical protein K0U83_09790 [bacterium]|nr:hypothetical protein [bacterium]
MSEKFRVGKAPNVGVPKHAFDIRRTADGGIKISNITDLSDVDRKVLYRHFGSSVTARAGGTMMDSQGDPLQFTVLETEEPGSEKHFVMAVLDLPLPFTVMG